MRTPWSRQRSPGACPSGLVPSALNISEHKDCGEAQDTGLSRMVSGHSPEV